MDQKKELRLYLDEAKCVLARLMPLVGRDFTIEVHAGALRTITLEAKTELGIRWLQYVREKFWEEQRAFLNERSEENVRSAVENRRRRTA